MDVAALLARMRSRRDYAGQLEHVEDSCPGAFREFCRAGNAAASQSSSRMLFGARRRPTLLASSRGARCGPLPVAIGSSSPARPAARRSATTCRCSRRHYRFSLTARSLYLYPTKALAQDQLKGLLELVATTRRCRVRANSTWRVRRRYADGAAATDSHRSESRALQSRHAARGHPALSSQVGAVLRRAALRGHRRSAYLPGNPRVRMCRR